MKLFNSLRNKLLILVMATTTSALCVASGIFLYYDAASFRASRISDLSTQTELLSFSAVPALQFDDAQVAQETLELLQLRPLIRAAAIYDERGALFAHYVREGLELSLPELPAPDTIETSQGILTIYRRIIENNEIVGTAYLTADYQLTERILNFLSILGLVALLAIAAATVVALWLQSLITRPIHSIVAITRDVVENGDYSQRVTRISQDEIGELVDSFNGMLSVVEQRTADLERSNHSLELEIHQSTQAKQTIETLNSQLESKVEERTRQLEVSNKELETFCYSVSHDLRGPLRSISGFSQALVEELPQDLGEEPRRYLNRILAATHRMGQLIEDLLNLSRVTRTELHRVEVDLSAIAHEVCGEMQRAYQHDVDITIWEGIKVNADPKLLRIVFDNLLSNAWKFSGKAKQAKIMVGEMKDGESSVFFVRDNGAGFDMRYADKLFGAFQRLHAMDEFPGTGVGLATVQRIIHRHGGRIWFDSSPGNGAVFYFTLQHMAATESPSSDQINGSSRDEVVPK